MEKNSHGTITTSIKAGQAHSVLVVGLVKIAKNRQTISHQASSIKAEEGEVANFLEIGCVLGAVKIAYEQLVRFTNIVATRARSNSSITFPFRRTCPDRGREGNNQTRRETKAGEGEQILP